MVVIKSTELFKLIEFVEDIKIIDMKRIIELPLDSILDNLKPKRFDKVDPTNINDNIGEIKYNLYDCGSQSCNLCVFRGQSLIYDEDPFPFRGDPFCWMSFMSQYSSSEKSKGMYKLYTNIEWFKETITKMKKNIDLCKK